MTQTICIIIMILFIVVVGTATILDSYAICKIKNKMFKDKVKIDIILKNSTLIKNQIIVSEDESIKLCKRYYKLYTKFEKFLLTRKYLILNLENLLNSVSNIDKKIIFNIDKKKLVKKIKKNAK